MDVIGLGVDAWDGQKAAWESMAAVEGLVNEFREYREFAKGKGATGRWIWVSAAYAVLHDAKYIEGMPDDLKRALAMTGGAPLPPPTSDWLDSLPRKVLSKDEMFDFLVSAMSLNKDEVRAKAPDLISYSMLRWARKSDENETKVMTAYLQKMAAATKTVEEDLFGGEERDLTRLFKELDKFVPSASAQGPESEPGISGDVAETGP